MPVRSASSISPPPTPALSGGLRALLLTLIGILLFGLFAREVYDSDFWWHLRTGQYIVEKRALPFPDPFVVDHRHGA